MKGSEDHTLLTYLALSNSGRGIGAKRTLLPVGQPLTAVSTLREQRCGSKAEETEMGILHLNQIFMEGI